VKVTARGAATVVGLPKTGPAYWKYQR